jgi:hypothetical protein
VNVSAVLLLISWATLESHVRNTAAASHEEELTSRFVYNIAHWWGLLHVLLPANVDNSFTLYQLRSLFVYILLLHRSAFLFIFTDSNYTYCCSEIVTSGKAIGSPRSVSTKTKLMISLRGRNCLWGTCNLFKFQHCIKKQWHHSYPVFISLDLNHHNKWFTHCTQRKSNWNLCSHNTRRFLYSYSSQDIKTGKSCKHLRLEVNTKFNKFNITRNTFHVSGHPVPSYVSLHGSSEFCVW